MSVVLRLSRAGRRHSPFYHINAFDVRTRRDGKPLESLGFYDPQGEKEAVRIDLERAKYWLEQGARPSETVASVLKAQGLPSSLWSKTRKKASKPKVKTAEKKVRAKSKRSVKKRTKSRTASSKKPEVAAK